MRSKVNVGHPKWPTAAIMSKLKKKKVAYRSEMARNAIKSEFRTSKLGAGGHFVNKKLQKVSYAIESEFCTSKMAVGSHFIKKFTTKIKLWY